jgi:DNA-binding NarL/FixJ family response regulator
MSLPDDLPPPDDIEAVVFDVGGDSYALLSFALPELELPRGLTAAEQRVIEGLLAGCSVIEIAHDRGTSPRTVNNQIAAVYAKVGVSCRAELVELCVRPAHEGERPSRTTLPGIPTETKQVG